MMGINITAATITNPAKEIRFNSLDGNVNGFIRHDFALAASEEQEILLGTTNEEFVKLRVFNSLSIRGASGVSFKLRIKYTFPRKAPVTEDHDILLNGKINQSTIESSPGTAKTITISVVAKNETGDVKVMQLRIHEPTTLREVV